MSQWTGGKEENHIVIHTGELPQLEGVVALVADAAGDALPHVGYDVPQPLLPHPLHGETVLLPQIGCMRERLIP